MQPPPGVDPAELPSAATLLDVREDDEWRAGHVAGSVHLPMSAIQRRTAELPAGDLVVVCRSGHRSGQVAAWLIGAGRQAANLTGGLQAWAARGLPLVTVDGTPGHVR